MSQRKTTAPPTPKHSRSSYSGRKGLIAKEKTKKQSARKRTALDNRFHRTFFHSAATCLHDPEARRNASPLNEPRKRRPKRTAARRLLRETVSKPWHVGFLDHFDDCRELDMRLLLHSHF